MASKRSVTARGSHKVPRVKILIELSRRARREVEKLLKRSEAGTIDNAELKKGLKEAEVPLRQMRDYINATLSDMSKLLKRTQASTITEKELNTKLNAVRKQVKRMLNHSNGFHH
jgi:chromosome condensin MukBEF complex kleisin-like MukF subunit